MSLATVQTRAAVGMDAPMVNVEVHLANGIPGFHLVGMAETTVKEARDRVRGALITSGFEFPAKRITVNLAPADLPKHGGRYDLPIALGILLASGQLPESCLADTEVYGELALSGELRPVKGLLPCAMACYQAKRHLLLPTENGNDAMWVEGIKFTPFTTLNQIIAHFHQHKVVAQTTAPAMQPNKQTVHRDWSDIVGQQQGKRALLTAAAGSHHVLMVGPAGTGKSLLASKFSQLLPPLTTQGGLEIAAIRSILGQSAPCCEHIERPFRQPHHTASAVALTGGGSTPRPGEVSLAHHGVLFLDELPEFGRHTLDVLREPLETGEVHIARAKGQASFPASFQLIAAMNPSPTGDIHDGRSTPDQVMRYLNRLSGPLLDRIDVQVEVPRLSEFHFANEADSQGFLTAQEAFELAEFARQKQYQRQGCLNGHLSLNALQRVAKISEADLAFFSQIAKQRELSLRVFHRCIKVARTLADLEDSDCVERHHLAEALGFRALDTLIRELTGH